MKQLWARIWIILTVILILAIIIRIINWFLNKSNWIKNKLTFSLKEKKKTMQIKKELKEKKEAIINPNIEDTTVDKEFQEVIETAVAEKNSWDIDENETNKSEWQNGIKNELAQTTKWEESESSLFNETVSLETPSEKVLDDKEKKQIYRIIKSFK